MSITVTDDALSQMSSVCDRQNVPVVRFELKGGGCGGLMSTWETEPHYEPTQGDLTWPLGLAIHTQEERVFVVDEFTAEFIEGGIINYDLTSFMPAFSVSVPGKGSCGCGESFVA
jgi:Fe-S cluster assembly iron-binding protein IscA